MTRSIATITGRSGAGKTTIAKHLLEERKDAVLIPSITTRAARECDLPGEYRYITDAEFTECVERDAFLWHTQPHGATRYGTLAADIDDVVDRDALGIMILVPDKVPTLQDYVLRTYQNTVRVRSVFLIQNDLTLLRARMRARGDSEDQIASRLESEDLWFANTNDHGRFYFIDGGKTEKDIPVVARAVLDEIEYVP